MIQWNVPEVIGFVEKEMGFKPDFGNCRTAAILKDEQMIAGFVFHDWQPEFETIEISGVATDPAWFTRDHICEILGYAFSFCQTCIAKTHEDNKRARRICKSFGAQEFILPRLRGRMASEAVLLLTDDAWAESKFMRSRNEKLEAANPT
jgi:RimJ/RimL family protein N-acetyltransferase